MGVERGGLHGKALGLEGGGECVQRAASRPLTMTWAPAPARARTMAAPRWPRLPETKAVLPSSRKRSCAMPAHQKPRSTCQCEGKQVFTIARRPLQLPAEQCCIATWTAGSPYWKQRAATVKLQIPSQWDTQQGLSSPAATSDAASQRDDLSMTSKFFLAAFSASLLFGAAHGAMAADAKAPKISTAVLKPLRQRRPRTTRRTFPPRWPPSNRPRPFPTARPMTIT